MPGSARPLTSKTKSVQRHLAYMGDEDPEPARTSPSGSNDNFSSCNAFPSSPAESVESGERVSERLEALLPLFPTTPTDAVVPLSAFPPTPPPPSLSAFPPPPTALRRLWSEYLEALRVSPLLTKSLTAGLSAVASDALSSALRPRAAHTSTSLLLVRRLRFFLYGLLWTGPTLHAWQRHMEARFPPSPSRRTPAEMALLKAAYDQVTWGPLQNLAFQTFLALSIERVSGKELKRRLAASFATIQMRAWTFWPVVALAQYRVVPPQLRPLTANIAALSWTVILLLR